jgi:hypothetical protein
MVEMRRTATKQRTKSRALAFLPLCLAIVIAGCSANTDPGADRIGATSATLRANVSCAQGEVCDGYFRWRVHGTTSWTNGSDVGTAPGPFITQLRYSGRFSPGTTYDYQFCGRGSDSSRYACAGPATLTSTGGYDSASGTAWSVFTTLRSVRTVTAQQFSDSIGVNDHITYGNEPLYSNQAAAVWNMKALGITHVRVPIFHWSNSGAQATFLNAFKTVQHGGFTLDAQVSQVCTDRYPAWDLRNPVDCISALKRDAGLSGVEAFEDPNEADNDGDPNWAMKLTAYDQAIYRAVKQVGNYAVYGPTLVNNSSFQTMGNQSRTFDFENFHDYRAATSPNPDAVRYEFDRQVSLAGLKPGVASETGYHNAVGCHDGCQAGVDQQGAAVYTLRTYLEHLADGIDRTYTYELYDEPNLPCGAPPCQEAHFGLIDGSGRWKPAAHALANLTSMIGSGGPETITPLVWTVDGGDPIGDLRYLDIERADGSHDLALWRTCMDADKLTCPASVWDPRAAKDLAVTPVTIHVNGSFAGWESGDPIAGRRFARGLGPIAVQIGADPVILHITPASTTPPESPALSNPPIGPISLGPLPDRLLRKCRLASRSRRGGSRTRPVTKKSPKRCRISGARHRRGRPGAH